ncbi:twin-arginine translocase TatA/TatE family subunit [Saccharolobus solfataricus]|uniref:Twin-arginine translocase TatA/TatE family subunit n=2 Tax=Saccharolobus solfataricus TaxID=2287 RepID=A0A0E3MDD5_SACSO|nr:twin-arginine translocase TatA/TatE family subunit [Saccharolobus solfataricus]AKA73778.1 twin-arginine translocase TatA/TatE family subunit [Saccharolobus solfataricus]AKA76475.1 twin-arginine translocase TatA/TatE family subunit [Saccharolobus solfataricus]AKA79168.1 twin-arginine translocase TatA/TatE family subunit [Saccharolobus solfataricus]AZF68253.1 twin-arginine translocase TatA/TatE family subunit [Saccharolobus solfataricus]AZF70873.1 twin-arginine translocase TatA/TatE family su
MINNLSDFLVVVVVFILLMAGDKNAGNTAKSIGRFLGELRKRQNEFKTELMRELNSVDNTNSVPPSSSNFKYVKVTNQDRVRELEAQIKRLQEELERLKASDGKN